MTRPDRRGGRGPAILLAGVLAVGATLVASPPAAAQSRTVQRILYGEVVSAERVVIEDRATGRGAQTGATVGAIAGYALADRGDRWLGSLLGGALGGAAGHAAERSAKKKPGWELIIRLDSGEEIGIEVPAQKKDKTQYNPGDKVRMMTGPGGETKVTHVTQ
jgi:outer membrane lipoprotein SlyB